VPAGTVSLKDYNVINSKYLLAEQYGFPYPSAARTCMAGVEEWADQHSVDVKEILFFFENGAKHKGQLEWIAERDTLPIPVFPEKKDLVPLQAGDLLAWLIHLGLTNQVHKPRYVKAYERIQEVSNRWRDVNLSDPERFPSVLGVGLRDPLKKYDCRIVKAGGKRRSVVVIRDKDDPRQFKLDKKNDVIPEIQYVPLEELFERAKRYDESVEERLGGFLLSAEGNSLGTK
jgi:hypothetical protein